MAFICSVSLSLSMEGCEAIVLVRCTALLLGYMQFLESDS